VFRYIVGNWWHDIFYLATYVIADQARFRRFIDLALLAGIALVCWWLLFHGGWQVILRDFGTASTTGHHIRPR
jgi:hypothetical protein